MVANTAEKDSEKIKNFETKWKNDGHYLHRDRECKVSVFASRNAGVNSEGKKRAKNLLTLSSRSRARLRTWPAARALVNDEC